MRKGGLRHAATTTVRLVVLGGLSLGGCAELNSDMSLGNGQTVEAISADRTPPPYPPLSKSGNDSPSLQAGTMGRSHWAIRRVVVPVSGVEHRPIYATGPTYADETARERGEFPSIYSALQLGGAESAWDQVFEAMAWPFWAGLDVALMPARAVVQPPWETIESPLVRHERAPIGTASPAMLGDPAAQAVPGVDVTPSVPPTSEPRWIWRNGKWYYWRQGDPEPWFGARPEHAPGGKVNVPKPQDLPQPVELKPRWIFRDGKWVRSDAAAPPAQAPSPAVTPEQKP
jgi:hypothetical protein